MSAPPPLPPPGPSAVPPKLPMAPQPRTRTSPLVKVICWSVGGLVLLVMGFIGFRTYQFAQWAKHHKPGPTDFFHEAARNIGPGHPNASGNSDEAREIAAEMSKLLLTIRTMGFEQADKKSLLDDKDQFRTYCDLRGNQCVFLIHVPELRRFTEEAQDSLASHAWKSALALLQSKNAGRDGMKLAIGMMGLVSYDRVMIGRYSLSSKGAAASPDAVQRGFGCERSLYEWFAPATTNSQGRLTSP